MIDLERFLNREIVYYVPHHRREEFLSILEKQTDINWFGGCRPTEFIPPIGDVNNEFDTCICTNKNWYGETCLVYGDLEYLKNNNVVIFE